MDIEKAPAISNYKWRHKGNMKRLYVVSVGQVVYYGSVLTHICDYINSVTQLKLRRAGLYDSVTLRVRKSPLYKGTRTTLLTNAQPDDWNKIAKNPNSVLVK